MLATGKRSISCHEAPGPKRRRLEPFERKAITSSTSSSSRHAPRSLRPATAVASPPSACSPKPADPSSVATGASPSPSVSLVSSSCSTTQRTSRGVPAWEDMSIAQRSRLERQYKAVLDRVWSGCLNILRCNASPYGIITCIGLWTGSKEEFWTLIRSHPGLMKTIERAQKSGQLHEVCSHPAFFNKANAVIDMTLDSVDDIFETIRKGTLPSVSFSRPAGDHAPMSKYWVDLVAQVTKLDMSVIDDVLSTKRKFLTASSTTKSRLLLQGLRHSWGFYFSFRTTSLPTNDASTPLVSQDLALALKHLEQSSATASAHGTHDVDQVFSALYLARILVLYQLLDSLPQSLSEDQARQEWLHFQLMPPRTAAGVDVFAAVFLRVVEGDAADLRRAAKCRLTALGWRNHKWFSKSFKAIYTGQGALVDLVKGRRPPLYLFVDEITVGRSSGSGAERRDVYRANRRRAAVHSLFSRADRG